MIVKAIIRIVVENGACVTFGVAVVGVVLALTFTVKATE
jgi:ATP-dependent exoDNAse (exonuclease V) beta subunit